MWTWVLLGKIDLVPQTEVDLLKPARVLTCPCEFPPAELESGLLKDGQMKRARFTEEQIIGVLREHEAGAKTADLAASTASRKRRCITGRPNTAAWMSPRPSD